MANKLVYKGHSIGETTQVSIMPTATADNSGAIVQYVGATNANYINGYFYKCVSDGGVTPAYSWEKIQVSDGGDTIQVETLPTASADELGNIYEFVGTTTANYINGRFYRCISGGTPTTPTYSWEEVDLGDGTPHWSGTRAEYEAIKNTLEAGTYVSITDDYDEGLEVVDVVENGNMNPVTSNAVAGILPQPYWTVKTQVWATGDLDVVFTAPTGKKFIFGTGSVIDNRRAYVTIMDEAPMISADGKTITLKFFTYSLNGAYTPTECSIYLNALVIDD